MPKRLRGAGSALLAALLLAARAAVAQEAVGEPHTFLRRYIGLSDKEITAVDRGEVVAKVLGTRDAAELAVFGVVRVDVSPEVLAAEVRDIERFKKSPAVLAIGTFGSPPSADDVRSLALDPKDVSALAGCRVGDCEVKLPAAWIERFRTGLRDPATRTARANELLRAMLLDRLAAYLSGGDAALDPYQDKREPQRLVVEFRRVLTHSPYLPVYVPELVRHLRDYPRAPIPASEEFFYWSVEEFGLKPVVSVTHVVIHARPRAGGAELVIASKQVYASHYFTSSLGLTSLVAEAADGSGGSAGGRYLMYLNRSRVDALGGALGPLKRTVVRRRLREGMERNLRAIKQRLESAAGAGGALVRPGEEGT